MGKTEDTKPETGSERRAIVLIDDDPALVERCVALINATHDLHVCGVATDRQSALEAITSSAPDLIVVGITPKTEKNRVQLLNELKTRWPEQPVLTLTQAAQDTTFSAQSLNSTSPVAVQHRAIETLPAAIRMILDRRKHFGKT